MQGKGVGGHEVGEQWDERAGGLGKGANRGSWGNLGARGSG